MSKTATAKRPGPPPLTEPDGQLVLTMDALRALAVFRATLRFASHDDVTPVICATHLVALNGRIRAYATDRYRVLTAPLPIVAALDADPADPVDHILGQVPADGVLIPNEIVEWVVATAPKHRRRTFGAYRLELVLERIENISLPAQPYQRVTARLTAIESPNRWTETSIVHMPGKFPPVSRLIDEARKAPLAEASPFALNPTLLTALKELVAKGEPIQFKPTTGSENKPGPIYFQTGAFDPDSAFEGLLQPNTGTTFPAVHA